MRRLQVLMDGAIAGVLEELPGSPVELEFRYDRSWLTNPERVALSIAMPLGGQAYPNHICAPYFANLLPEGDPRDALGRRLGIAPNDIFGLLEAIGRDCAGAVVILPEAVTPDESGRPRNPEKSAPLSDAELTHLIDDLPQRPLGIDADDGGVRLSLAGVQDKLVLAQTPDGWHLPNASLPSTHIVKPPISRLGGSVENEGLCLELARQSGLDVAHADIAILGGRPCLVVERYDRATLNGIVKRIHQEDFCQALCRWPTQKYENAGGPSLGECFRILESTSEPGIDRLKLLDAVAFNVLIGNVDAHAKNYSLLHRPSGSIRLAPLYDLVCGAIYDHVTRNLAMSIGHSRRGDHIYAGNWDDFAREAGLGPAGVRRRVRALVERSLDALSAAVSAIHERVPDSAYLHLVEAHVKRRGRAMLTNLAFKNAEAARAV